MQKITPFLWFDGKAEEAIKLYTSLFKNSKIVNIAYWPEGSPFPTGQVMNGVFDLTGVAVLDDFDLIAFGIWLSVALLQRLKLCHLLIIRLLN